MVLSLDRWVGKVAVVTGASSGIGASIAEHLVQEGLIVVGLARRSEIVEEKAKKLVGKKGKLYGVKTDMSKEEDIVKAFKWVERNIGHIHVLVNSAGVISWTSLSNGDAQAWRQTLEVNILGLCVATREAVKSMTANNTQGHIIHINSVVGHKIPNMQGMNIYTASKHAVTALAATLKQELDAGGSKIKISSVSPGMVASEMTTFSRNNTKEMQTAMEAAPILQPADVAGAVCYVLSTPEHVQVPELTIAPVGE